MSQHIAAQLHQALSPVVTESDLHLEAVTVKGVPPKRVVTVVVDLPDGPGGVSSDALGEVSRAISAVLDEADDALRGGYLLEVSTPGVGRPLTGPRHFRRAQGRLVSVQTPDGDVRGRVLGADDDGVRIQPEGTKPNRGTEPVTLAWAEVRGGTVELEFNRN